MDSYDRIVLMDGRPECPCVLSDSPFYRHREEEVLVRGERWLFMFPHCYPHWRYTGVGSSIQGNVLFAMESKYGDRFVGFRTAVCFVERYCQAYLWHHATNLKWGKNSEGWVRSLTPGLHAISGRVDPMYRLRDIVAAIPRKYFLRREKVRCEYCGKWKRYFPQRPERHAQENWKHELCDELLFAEQNPKEQEHVWLRQARQTLTDARNWMAKPERREEIQRRFRQSQERAQSLSRAKALRRAKTSPTA